MFDHMQHLGLLLPLHSGPENQRPDNELVSSTLVPSIHIRTGMEGWALDGPVEHARRSLGLQAGPGGAAVLTPDASAGCCSLIRPGHSSIAHSLLVEPCLKLTRSWDGPIGAAKLPASGLQRAAGPTQATCMHAPSTEQLARVMSWTSERPSWLEQISSIVLQVPGRGQAARRLTLMPPKPAASARLSICASTGC